MNSTILGTVLKISSFRQRYSRTEKNTAEQRKKNRIEMRYERKRRSPNSRIFGSVLRIVTFGVLVVLSVSWYGAAYKTSKKCTAEAVGTVVSVESVYHGGRNSGYTYTAQVEPSDGSLFGEELLTSIRSSYKFRQGEIVTIFYEPGSVSNCYSQHARPGEWMDKVILIFAADLLIDGFLLYRALKDKKRGL